MSATGTVGSLVLGYFLKLHIKESGTLFSGRWVLYNCLGSSDTL